MAEAKKTEEATKDEKEKKEKAEATKTEQAALDQKLKDVKGLEESLAK